ncbi:MAG: hypothetical protein AAFR78_09870 [Planctomycetota bacterium]
MIERIPLGALFEIQRPISLVWEGGFVWLGFHVRLTSRQQAMIVLAKWNTLREFSNHLS